MSWTPYAFVAFYAAFIGHELPPLGGTLPAMFAKSAFVWSSAIFLYSNRKARKTILGAYGAEISEDSEYKTSTGGRKSQYYLSKVDEIHNSTTSCESNFFDRSFVKRQK